jgi:hypothetical protein
LRPSVKWFFGEVAGKFCEGAKEQDVLFLASEYAPLKAKLYAAGEHNRVLYRRKLVAHFPRTNLFLAPGLIVYVVRWHCAVGYQLPANQWRIRNRDSQSGEEKKNANGHSSSLMPELIAAVISVN